MSAYSQTHARPALVLPLLTLVLIWALVHAALVVFHQVPAFDSGFLGPDSYMRMVRIGELAEHHRWFDTTIERANAPHGDVLHWTRPFDVLVMLLALPFAPLLGTTKALYVAGVVVSPLMQLLTGLALIWAMRPVLRPGVWLLPAVALFLQPGALPYSILGRADHHSLLLMVFVIVAGFMLRALRNPLDARPALLGGLAAGFGIWLSVEFLLVVGACLAALGLPWLASERERAAQNKWFALGLCLVTLAALFSERPFDRFLEPSYDSVSCVHYLLFASIMVFWRGIETLENRNRGGARLPNRLLLSLVGVGGVALLVNAAYPLFFHGPMVGVDPRIVPLWLDRVQEMQPLVPRDRQSLGSMIFYLGGIALAGPVFVKMILEAYGRGRFFPLVFIAIACLLLTAAAISHLRFSGYAEVTFIMAFAVVLDRFLRWSGQIGNDLLRGLLRGGFVGLMMFGPVLVGGTLMTRNAAATDAAAEAETGCDVRAVAAYLESDPRWSAQPQTILTFMDIGPELLYRTSHRVIGTPYHRNGDGIFDGHQALATGDDTAARALMAERGVDLVLLCRSAAERLFYAPAHGEQNLYQRLDKGNAPTWLAPVALPSELAQQARLYRFLR